MLKLILIILAIVCFILAAVPVQVGKASIGWLGAALWAISTVV